MRFGSRKMRKIIISKQSTAKSYSLPKKRSHVIHLDEYVNYYKLTHKSGTTLFRKSNLNFHLTQNAYNMIFALFNAKNFFIFLPILTVRGPKYQDTMMILKW